MDKYCLPTGYKTNENVQHHDDTPFTDSHQREVYEYANEIMVNNNFSSVVDVGCGSGFKLIKYLGNYKTIGVETEPCYSFLKSKYPDRMWVLSGDPEKSFAKHEFEADLTICSDVIEHIVDPDLLVEYLTSLKSKYYIISTPCRNVMANVHKNTNINGPPGNAAHVREWTFDEFKMYISTKFTLVESFYGKEQIDCAWHLLKNF